MGIRTAFYREIVYRAATSLRGQRVFTRLKDLRTTQWHETTRLQEAQATALSELLSEVRISSPFYAERLAGAGRVTPARAFEILDSLPFLTKQDIRDSAGRLRTRGLPLPTTRKTTGGSTGEPLTVAKSYGAVAWELAAAARGYEWAGVALGEPQARFWGVPITTWGRHRAALIDAVCHRIRLSAFSFSDESFPEYEARISRFRPTHFYGYASMLGEFARWYERRGVQPPFEVAAIISTSEVLTRPTRDLLHRVFGARVVDEYGCGEVGTIAHECEHGSLHLNMENLVVEVLPEGGFNGLGELVVTDLRNRVFPLIRFRIGDFGRFSAGPCECGRGLAVLAGVSGRSYDMIVDSRGRKHHPEAVMYVLEEAQARTPDIRQFQAVQTHRGAIELRFVAESTPAVERHVNRIVDRLREAIDPNLEITSVRVDKIDRAASGKMRVVVGMPGLTEVSNGARGGA